MNLSLGFFDMHYVIDLPVIWVNMDDVRIGDFELFFIDSGRIALDGGAMFGSVPKTLWSKWTDVDDKNRIPLSTRSLLVKAKDRNVLIDAGIGTEWDEAFKQRLALSSTPIAEAIESKADIKADQITDVVVTHWHFDHVGGLISNPFMNAAIHCSATNFKSAQNPNAKEKASFIEKTWSPFTKSGQMQIVELKESGAQKEIIPGIWVQRSDGHTLGQLIVHINSNNEHAVFCADLMPTSMHLKPHYSMGFDIQPLLLLEEKNHLLQMASKENWTLIFEHDPKTSHGKILKDKNLKYKLV